MRRWMGVGRRQETVVVADIGPESGRKGKTSSIVVVQAMWLLWGTSDSTVNTNFDGHNHNAVLGRELLLSWRESTSLDLASLEGGDCPTTQVLWIRATNRSLHHARIRTRCFGTECTQIRGQTMAMEEDMAGEGIIIPYHSLRCLTRQVVETGRAGGKI